MLQLLIYQLSCHSGRIFVFLLFLTQYYQPYIQWLLKALTSMTMLPGPEADHSLASSVEVMEWSCNLTPPYTYVAYSFKLADSFTLAVR